MNKWLLLALKDEAIHFWSGFFSGLGAYCATWITLSPLSQKVCRSRGRTWLDTLAARCIGLLPWLVGLSVESFVHLSLDGLL